MPPTAGFQGPTGYKGEQGEVGKDGEKVNEGPGGWWLERRVLGRGCGLGRPPWMVGVRERVLAASGVHRVQGLCGAQLVRARRAGPGSRDTPLPAQSHVVP